MPYRFAPPLRGLAVAGWLACAATPLALPVPAVAAEAADAQLDLDLPAGPLATSLTRIGQLGGRSIAADPALVAGRQAPAITGRMTAFEAVQRALAGSDLRPVGVAGGAITIQRMPGGPSAAAPEVQTMPAVSVSTDRLASDLMAPTRSVTVIDGETLEDLRDSSPNLATMLTKAVPGMSDSSRNLTDFGQTLRGRNALILVDGIPLNTNRDSSRNLVNIDPGRIERIEVVRGSNAIYGSGATGGIISITTRQPGGEPISETKVGMDMSLSNPGAKGMGGDVQHFFSGSKDRLDYELDVSYRRIGGSYDAHGDRIAPDASQGDLFDSNTYSLGGKLGFRIDANQRVQLAASYLRARQDTDYASDPAVSRTPLGSTNARAIKGLDLARQNEVENTLVSLSYEHKDLWGSSLSALTYARDSSTRFAPSDSRSNVNRGNNVDQVMQNNKVFGGRLTIDTPLTASRDTALTWGADFIQERSEMPLDVFDPVIYDQSGGLQFRRTGTNTYLPWTTTRSIGIFTQLQHRFNERWSAEAGVRYERSSAWFDDFQPLSQSRLANPATVDGGRVSYDAFMYNAGLLFKPTDNHEFYGSFSQGFDLPDVGLQLRNARAGFDINSSDLQAVKTNNYELGWRGRFASTAATVAVFRSDSKLGAVQSFNNGLTLTRTRERIHGVEATVDHYFDDDIWAVGGTFTWMYGKEKAPGASSERIMTGYRIPPLKLTAYTQYRPNERWRTRAELTWFGARDYRLSDGRTQFARADVKSYLTVDLMARYDLDKQNAFTFSVQNLFNRQYLPLYSQLLRSGNNNSRLPAAGAVASVTYTHRW
ncbi:TonB-dependent siderophore receptor [Bordetella genomosp. 5]|uniref:TonB-dependent siderophore receptor n=1 Tax=Bordetella genomosp. 5 TaxID=1395608 RepID=A0A261TWC0_9BORD|nr:TonB-dependent receptor [Bordetella genomosp. 5]OZI44777.1 TonB-dependent siderophore receptor [Bordetella genomosp. 5]OZI53705.1 TonB-dependent siderophore receptor [Bordetella genomosp. 5]